MKTSSLQLLPSTTHGTASGNYDGSSLDFEGDRQKAASYYLQSNDLQTVALFTTALVGVVKIQASLATTPTASDWFDVYTFPSDGSSEYTDNVSVNITGNFTWIRAAVTDFTAGTINKATLSY